MFNGGVNLTLLKLHCVVPVKCLHDLLFVGLFYREAVVAVDRLSEKEMEEFLPQKRSRLYGITTTPSQCPQGMTGFREQETIKERNQGSKEGNKQ